MKKFFNVTGIFALLAIMTLGFASCQQKNEPTSQSTNQQTGTDELTIVGTWKVVMVESYDGEKTERTDGDDVVVTINKDNSGFSKKGDTVLTKFTYTVVGKNLILDQGGYVIKVEIKELTKDVLVLRVTFGDEWEETTLKRIN